MKKAANRLIYVMCVKMKNIILISILLLANKALFAQSINEIIATPPTEAAENAYTSGNTKLIKVSGCSNAVQGYKGRQPVNPPRQLWKTCEELFGKEQYQKMKQLEAWAKQYNQYMMSKFK
ncbi:MAG: hypothetical protein OEY11_14405 [Gammaproteobacteria bacterium]|nr:hypothetical protein [Gammaproteobacteria bacterium]